MSDRVQLNLRLDKHPKIYELIKQRAKKEGSSINDYAINVLGRELGLEIDQTPVAQALERISSLEQRMEKLESSLSGETPAWVPKNMQQKFKNSGRETKTLECSLLKLGRKLLIRSAS